MDNLYKAYNTLVEQMVNAGVAKDSRFVDLGLPIRPVKLYKKKATQLNCWAAYIFYISYVH
jgi:hypothetical protein